MDIKGFVGRAKDAANAAADKAKEMANSVAEQSRTAAPSALPEGEAPIAADHALVPADGAPLPATTEPAKGLSLFSGDKFNELKNLGAEKVQEMVTAFQQALPAIKDAGYELTEFEIELGVTPKLIPHFRHALQSAEDVELARERLRENKLGTIILTALLKAGEVQKQIKVYGFAFSHIEIELGLIPSVRLQYKQD